jgi:hypothetical protein
VKKWLKREETGRTLWEGVWNEEKIRKRSSQDERHQDENGAVWAGISIDELSRQRRIQPFAIINKKAFSWWYLIFCLWNLDWLIACGAKSSFAKFTELMFLLVSIWIL